MIRRSLVLMLLVTGTAACGDIPQPFRHEGQPDSLARPKLTRGVTVHPVADSPVGAAFADALVRALEDQEIPARLQTGPAFGYVIDGQMLDTGKEFVLRWRLLAPGGAEAVSHVQTIAKATLAQADPVLMKRSAAGAALALSAPLADPDAQPAAGAAAGADNRIIVKVVPLRGLPGDGDKTMTAAIKRALDRGGLLVKDDGADYMVEGKVTVVPGLPGEDSMTVAWVLKRVEGGNQLANIGQSGAVPRGRLSGSWGLLARDIAEGGAAGLLEVIQADTRTARRR